MSELKTKQTDADVLAFIWTCSKGDTHNNRFPASEILEERTMEIPDTTYPVIKKYGFRHEL